MLIKQLKVNRFKQLRDIDFTFPAQGSFLIEGRNEAGKSTLFEAIYFGLFGAGLVTTGTLEDLIAYGSDSSVVELTIQIGDKLFNVQRILHRGRPNEAELIIEYPDGNLERLSTIKSVNARLIDELGLDGDSLLNSCFVEQKNLERLESLSASDRKEALMKLLNLERLTDLEEEFKVKPKDKEELENLNRKFELAKLQAELPGLEKAKSQVEHKLTLIDLKRTFNEIEEQRKSIDKLNQEIINLTPQRNELEERVKGIERVKSNRETVERILANLSTMIEQWQAAKELKKSVKELESLEANIPARDEKIKALGLLDSRMERLAKLNERLQDAANRKKEVDNEIQQLNKLKSSRDAEIKRLKDDEAELSKLKQEEQRLAKLVKLIEQLKALQNWRRAKYTADAIGVIREREERVTKNKDELQVNHQKVKALLVHEKNKFIIYLFAGSVCLGVSIYLSIAFNPWYLVGLGIIAMGTLVRACCSVRKSKRYKESFNGIVQQLEGIEKEILKLEGQKESAREGGEREEGKLEEYSQDLCSLGLEVPESLESCDELIEERSGELAAVDQAKLIADYQEIKRNIYAVESGIRAIERRKEEIERELSQYDEQALLGMRSDLETRIQRIQSIINKWQPILEQKLESIGLPLDGKLLRDKLTHENAELERDRREIAKKAEYLQRIKDYQQRFLNLQKDNKEKHQSLKASLTDLTEWSNKLGPRFYKELLSNLNAKLKELGEEKTLKELETARSKIDGAHSAIRVRKQNIEPLERAKKEFIRQLDIFIPKPQIEPQDVVNLIPEFGQIKIEEKDSLAKTRDELLGKLESVRTDIEELASELYLEPQQLDLETCKQERDTKAREHQVRNKAIEIVDAARRNIADKVLPNTIRNMRRILPILTVDRYHDAEIDDDYRITVWDERAQAPRAKKIFSGGTRDQISLALRLSFALATLPQERGTAPSFIFLDEPLSSFDAERAQALLELLTRGEIANNFDQIFVISHSQILDPSEFNYQIVMDGGRIVSHNLDE